MHRDLQRLLRSASGESSFVLAVNVDIRGFSSFFSDSSQAAAYLSRAYTRVLDDYFPDVSFFKPTGDGLLLVKVIEEKSLKETVTSFITAAIKLNSEFADICAASDLINFATPPYVGIGLARGTATKISSGRKTLDFSGLPLNLASRLMDLARPSGVVFDESLGPQLLDDELLSQFDKSAAYVKGIADQTPLTVYATDAVRIPDANRRPFGAERYTQPEDKISFREVKNRVPTFVYRFQRRPSTLALDSITLHVQFPSTTANGAKHSLLSKTVDFNPDAVVDGPKGPEAQFDFALIEQVLAGSGVKSTWPVTFRLAYLVPLESQSAPEVPSLKRRGRVRPAIQIPKNPK
jgi:class 3 adenylate cyclase